MSLRGVLCTVLFLTGMVSTRLVAAQPADDAFSARDDLLLRKPTLGQFLQIRLRDGSQYQGQLVALEEREFIALSFSSAERVRFPWNDIVDFRSRAAPSAQAPADAPLSADEVRVRVEGDSSIYLKTQRYDQDGRLTDEFVDAGCKAGQGCGLDPRRTYKASAKHMSDSHAFHIPDRSDQEIRLQLRSGSTALHATGIVLLVGGCIATTTAMFIGIFETLPPFQTQTNTPGVVLGLLGGASVIAGIVLVIEAKIGIHIEVPPRSRSLGGVALGRSLRLTGSGLVF